MKIYRILTNKSDFKRVLNKEADDLCRDEFFLITTDIGAFRAIAVDKFYTISKFNSLFSGYNIDKNGVSIDMNQYLDVNNNAISDMELSELEPLIIDKLFSERVYQEHLIDDDPVEQAKNELAVMISRNIEFDYLHNLENEMTTYTFPFEIYELEDKEKAFDDALKSGLNYYEYKSRFL